MRGSSLLSPWRFSITFCFSGPFRSKRPLVEFFSAIKTKKNIVDKKYRKVLKQLKSKIKSSNIIEVSERLELELIVQLSIRDDSLGIAFYFENFRKL